jgi:type 1 glutamine amidotransferase
MRCLRILAAVGLLALASNAFAADPPKKVLLVTHSDGFMHDSILVAEQTLKDLGAKNNFEVTVFRFTKDPEAKVKKKVNGQDVEMTALEAYSKDFRDRTGEQGKPGEEVTKENCGRVNAETLKKFDLVFFYTTGKPITPEELKDLVAWVKAGGAFVATHSGTDTLYDSEYGDLVGGYFDGHPWHQKVKLHVEDAKHPGGKGFKEGDEITDEIYQFREQPYSRDKLHVILSIDNSSIDVSKGKRKDMDYAVAWCHEMDKGREFYTSLGHRREVWRDPRYQEHLLGGIQWALGREKGDATPSAKLKDK